MNNSILYQDKKDKVLVEAYSPSIIRVRHTRVSKFKSFDWALEDIKPIDEVVVEGNNSLITSSLKVVIDERGYIEFYKKVKMKLGFKKKVTKSTKEGGRSLLNAGGDLFKAEVLFQAYDDEKIWGMGQHQYNAFDQKVLFSH